MSDRLVSARFLYPVLLPGPPTRLLQATSSAEFPLVLADGCVVLSLPEGRSVRVPLSNVASFVTEVPPSATPEPGRRSGRPGRA